MVVCCFFGCCGEGVRCKGVEELVEVDWYVFLGGDVVLLGEDGEEDGLVLEFEIV